jgi:hypothetical protein
MSECHCEREKDDMTRAIQRLTYALTDILAENKIQFQWMVTHHHFATKTDLENVKNTIMSAISDFSALFTAFQDRQDAAVAALQADVKNLNDQIAALQGSQGQITPSDQALLDQIQSRASSIADKLDALDALTPPVVVTDGSGAVPVATPVARSTSADRRS